MWLPLFSIMSLISVAGLVVMACAIWFEDF